MGIMMQDFDFGFSLADIGPPLDSADHLAAMLDYMSTKGMKCLDFPGHTNGDIHRFNRKGNGGAKDCWAVFFDNNVSAGAFGDWSTNESYTWRSGAYDTLPFVERMELDKKLKAAIEANKERREQKQETMAKIASEKINNLSPAKPDHPYLVGKNIKPYKAMQEGGTLYIPAYGPDGKIQTYQSINSQGEKRFLAGAKAKEAFCPIGAPSETVYFCEGYATGATIHEVTGQQVIVAFDSGNLYHVTKLFADKYKGKRLIIAADNDQWKDKNTGLEAAKKIKNELGFEYVLPEFKGADLGLLKPTDFNDLAQFAGSEEVRVQLLPEEEEQSVFTIGELRANPPELPNSWWHEGGIFERSRVLLAGAPKAGKSTFIWRLASAGACGGSFLGEEFTRPIKTLWINAEIALPFAWRNIQKFFPSDPDKLRMVDRNLIISDRCRKRLEKPADQEWLKRQIDKHRPDLVILDPVINLSTANENDSGEVIDLLYTAENIVQSFSDASLMVCHHIKKKKIADVEDPFELVRGSGAWVGWMDSGLMIHGKGNEKMLYYNFRNVQSPSTHGLDIDWDSGSVDIRFTSGDNATAKRFLTIESVLKKNPKGLRRNELIIKIMKQDKVGDSSADAAIATAIKEGFIVGEGKQGSKNRVYYLSGYDRFGG